MSKIRKLDISGSEEGSVESREAVSTSGSVMSDGTMVSAMIRLGQSYNEGLSAMGQEMLDFSRTRLSRDAVAALSIARCKDWSEASKIQQDWLRTTTEEYVTEMGKLFQLAVKTTMESYRPLQDQAEATWSSNGSGG